MLTLKSCGILGKSFSLLQSWSSHLRMRWVMVMVMMVLVILEMMVTVMWVVMVIW